jgi:hypothetical protein
VAQLFANEARRRNEVALSRLREIEVAERGGMLSPDDDANIRQRDVELLS